MPEIKLKNVTKRWGKFYAVENLNLDIEDNSFITLLGPSGCGKTTTLRMIAGLETPTSGRIEIGDQVVFDSEKGINIPANKRKVGFLFQNYALWPNMTVYKNIAFGLSNVKEELPKYDFEAKTAARIIEIITNANEVVKKILECNDKKGNINEAKALTLLIDTYQISIYTAKKILSYGLHKEKDAQRVANIFIRELTDKMEWLKKSVTSAKMEWNEEYALLKDKKIVTSVRKLTKEEIDLAVRRVSRIVKIGMFMDRYPAELSGGQQQRVAIARTLAPEPTVLFMDEPLSNLDAKLRLEMRYELQRLHVETGSTFVYVTHDQMEAMTLATKICLINNGVLQQYEPPLTIYNHPANLFVADFVGNPSINFIEAKGKQNEDGSIQLEFLDQYKGIFQSVDPIALDEWFMKRDQMSCEEEENRKLKQKDKKYVEKENKDERFRYHIAKVIEDDLSMIEEPVITNEDFVLGIRPEFLRIVENGSLEGVIYGAMPTGMESTIKVKVGEYLLTGVVFGGTSYKIGTAIHFDLTSENLMLFDRRSGKLITLGRLQKM